MTSGSAGARGRSWRGKIRRRAGRWKRQVSARWTRPDFAPQPQAGATAPVGRRVIRPATPFRESAAAIQDWREGSPNRVAVLLHVFYPELVPELVEAVHRIPVPVDVIVTNATQAKVAFPLRSDDRLLLLPTQNRGRDILPLIDVVNSGLLDPYELVVKVHTKQSGWRATHDLPGDGAAWRTSLLSAVLGSTDAITRILSGFATDPRLGLVTDQASLLGPEHWGDNEQLVADLLRRIEMPLIRDDLQFAGGSVYWIRGFVLAGLRSLNLSSDDFPVEAGQVNQTNAHAVERVIGLLCREGGLTLSAPDGLPAQTSAAWERYLPDAPVTPRARAVPFYLPQFHPIPENDVWWGKGFTEWFNVAAARPLYPGHHQPRLPMGLGFYDLRTPETVSEQCQLAVQNGLAGFMYYNYWFAGHRLLERPITDRLSDKNDLPFCLMWANENWTRSWDGGSDDILIAQSHDAVPPEEYLRSVLPILADPRYLRIDGRALLAVYRPKQLPDPEATFGAWRHMARENGAGELLLVGVDGGAEFGEDLPPPHAFGMDATMTFAPHGLLWEPADPTRVGLAAGQRVRTWSYQAMVDDALAAYRNGLAATHIPGVMVAFDNSARRSEWPDIWLGANPYTYRRWLAGAVDAVADRPSDERIVFINAWNEWAEAAVLEPSDRYGSTYLLATRSALIP